MVVFLFLSLLVLVFEWTGLRGQISVDYLRHQVLGHRLGGLVVFILLFSLGNLIQIPGWLFLAAAVLTMGKIYGGMATYIAACVSCAVTFLIIRYVGGDVLRQIESKFAEKALKHLHAQPIRSVIMLRVLFQTMPALNYTLSMSGVPFRKYMMGTFLGLPVPIILYCFLFDYLAQMLRLT